MYVENVSYIVIFTSLTLIDKPVLFQTPRCDTSHLLLVLTKTPDFCPIIRFHAISLCKEALLPGRKRWRFLIPRWHSVGGPLTKFYYLTLNLIFSASKQNLNILLRIFWAIYMIIIPAKFQPSSFKTVRGERGDRHTHRWHVLWSANSKEKLYIARLGKMHIYFIMSYWILKAQKVSHNLMLVSTKKVTHLCLENITHY